MILFDGVCNLCNRGMLFLCRRDPAGRFRLAPLQSEIATALLRDVGIDSATDSLVVIEDGRALLRSAAVLRIVSRLRWPWPLLYGLVIIPRPMRDWLYRIVAANRYRWFGTRAQCAPAPELAERFIGS